MEKLNYSILINAPKEKVWHTMLDKEPYKEWTSVFNPSGSYYEGEWRTGSQIRFIGPEKDGTVSGIISEVAELRPFEFSSLKHLKELIKGVEKPFAEGSEMYENYTFTDKGDGTEVLAELSTSGNFPPEYSTMFNDMWPKALLKLKEIAEK